MVTNHQFKSISRRPSLAKRFGRALNVIKKRVKPRACIFQSNKSTWLQHPYWEGSETWDRNIPVSALKNFEISDSAETFGAVQGTHLLC